MTDPLSYPSQSPKDVSGLPQSGTSPEQDNAQNQQKIKIAVEHQQQSDIDVSEPSEKLGSFPVLSEFDLKLTKDQLEVFRNITRLLASKAIDLAEKEAIMTDRKRRKEAKRQDLKS